MNISQSRVNLPRLFRWRGMVKFGVLDFVTRKVVIPMILSDKMDVQNPDLVLVKKGTMSTLLKLNGEKVFSNWYSNWISSI